MRTSEYPKPLYKGIVSLATWKTAHLRLCLTCISYVSLAPWRTAHLYFKPSAHITCSCGWGGVVWGVKTSLAIDTGTISHRYELFLALAHRHATLSDLLLTLAWGVGWGGVGKPQLPHPPDVETDDVEIKMMPMMMTMTMTTTTTMMMMAMMRALMMMMMMTMTMAMAMTETMMMTMTMTMAMMMMMMMLKKKKGRRSRRRRR